MSKDLKLTPASQWRKTELVELPSGNVAELQRMNVLAMIQRGGVDTPNFLKDQVAASLRQNGAKKTAQNMQFELSDVTEAVETIIFFAKHAFVKPRLVDREDDLGDDEVFVGHVGEQDLMYAMSYALGDSASLTALKEFRQESDSDVESVSTEPVMEASTE